MPELYLTIPAELDGQTVRQAAMKGLGMSNGLFKRAKFHGQILLDGAPVLANAAIRAGQTLRLSFPEKENTAPAPAARRPVPGTAFFGRKTIAVWSGFGWTRAAPIRFGCI